MTTLERMHERDVKATADKYARELKEMEEKHKAETAEIRRQYEQEMTNKTAALVQDKAKLMGMVVPPEV
ncbi:hypothetical protein ACEQ8H_008521 [Pleosporales sp. CAS-2024a]